VELFTMNSLLASFQQSVHQFLIHYFYKEFLDRELWNN
jgi:hypothetical protein